MAAVREYFESYWPAPLCHIPNTWVVLPRQHSTTNNQYVNTQVYCRKIYLKMSVEWPKQVFCIQPSSPRDKEPSSISVAQKIPNPNCTPLSQRPLPQGLIFRTRLGSPGENSVLLQRHQCK